MIHGNYEPVMSNFNKLLEAAALVFFALLVLFDVLANLSKDVGRKTLLEKIGLCFFAVAVVAEIAAYPYGQRNDHLSGQLIGSLDATARQASSDASQALAVSGTALSQATDALTRAGKAEESLGKAENEAQGARNAASSALTLARGARKEADSFEKEILSAQEVATEAEAKLADRTLSDAQVRIIAGKLSVFSGQKYTITAYWDSKESLGIANRIYAALQLARWSYSSEGEKDFLLGGIIGVQVWTHPDADEAAKKAADSLIAALNAEGIEAIPKLQNPKNPKTNMIAINVGSKR